MLDLLNVGMIERAVYEMLVDGPSRTVPELCDALDLPEDRIRRATDELVAHCLLEQSAEEPPRYAVAASEEALEQLFSDSEHALQRARKYAAHLMTRMHVGAAGSGGADPAELIEIVTGRTEILKRFRQLQRSAREQVRGMDRPPYAYRQDDNHSTELSLLAAGVRYRVLYDAAGLEEFHDLRNSIEFGVLAGEEAKVMNGSPTKLVIVDDHTACLPLQATPQSPPGLVIVRPSGLLDALIALFECLWRLALPLQFTTNDEVGLPSLDEPSPGELRLISLLATGLPDSTIANRLGISHRTYQRRLRSVLNRLGAQTRFQAGIQAARRGWI